MFGFTRWFKKNVFLLHKIMFCVKAVSLISVLFLWNSGSFYFFAPWKILQNKRSVKEISTTLHYITFMDIYKWEWVAYLLGLSLIVQNHLPPPDSCRLSATEHFPSHSTLFFPFPLRAPKSKLLLLLRAGLCNSNLCNRIATLNTSICSPRSASYVFARVQSASFPDLHYWPRVSEWERERVRDMGEITEAVTVRMGLSIRAAKCAHHCSQVGRQTEKNCTESQMNANTFWLL